MKIFKIFNPFLASIVALLVLTGCETQPQKTVTQPRASLDSLSEVDSALLDSAVTSMRNEQFAQAENDLKILLTRRKDVAEPWINYALSLYHQDKSGPLNSAVIELEKRFPNVAPVYNLKGLIAVQDGRFGDARKAYEKALAIDSQYTNAWFNLAYLEDVYFQDIPAAIEHYDRYLQLRPDDQQVKAWREHLAFSAGEQ